MTHLMNTTFVAHSSLALAVIVAVWSPIQSQSSKPAETKAIAQAPMVEQCQAMKDQKAKMLAAMKTDDVELTALVARMNSATADRKVDSMASVLTRMVEQRTAMTPAMEKLGADMMKHMMQHMQMGKESMSQCPMMKDMKDTKDVNDKSAGGHSEHHEQKN